MQRILARGRESRSTNAVVVFGARATFRPRSEIEGAAFEFAAEEIEKWITMPSAAEPDGSKAWDLESSARRRWEIDRFVARQPAPTGVIFSACRRYRF